MERNNHEKLIYCLFRIFIAEADQTYTNADEFGFSVNQESLTLKYKWYD